MANKLKTIEAGQSLWAIVNQFVIIQKIIAKMFIWHFIAHVEMWKNLSWAREDWSSIEILSGNVVLYFGPRR